MIVPPEAQVLLARPEFPALLTGISCFSTLGCPELSLAEAAALAQKFRLPFLEIRALENRTDLPALLATFPGGWSGARDYLHERDLSPRVLGTSFKLMGNSEAHWEELFAFARLAQDLEAPWLRVFSGGAWGDSLTAVDYSAAAASLHRWRQEKSKHGWRADLLLETHDSFSASSPCVRLLELLDEPVNFIWDSHHTWYLGGETPAQTWRALAPYVRHVHVKDSISVPSARHPFTYVLPGQGGMPVLSVLELLSRDGFHGSVSLEWEKMWHPYLPSLPEALTACREKGWV